MMLANDMQIKYYRGLKYGELTSWKNGTVRYPTSIATPLNGNNYVPIFIPKYYTKPGPASVVIDLLISPINMTIPIIMDLVTAKSLYSLLPISSTLKTSMVNATPLRSPRQPQKNAPIMATTEHSMLQ